MKKIVTSGFLLVLSCFVLGSTNNLKKLNSAITQSKSGQKEFVQSILTEIRIDYEANKALFYPYNEYEVGFNPMTWDYDNALMEKHSKAHKTNLYNILFKHILRGELTVYNPTDPMWFATRDKGYLHFPLNTENFSSEKGKVYANDSILKECLKREQILGYRDYSNSLVAIESMAYPGEDSLNNGRVVYYERPFLWYIDRDILGYLLREELVMDENGVVVNRRIKAIAPVVNLIDFGTGNVIGTKLLFWVDFEELNPILKNYYVLLDGIYERKVKSFSQIFKERIFISNVIEQDSSFVIPSK
jgi:hypothetical protein